MKYLCDRSKLGYICAFFFIQSFSQLFYLLECLSYLGDLCSILDFLAIQCYLPIHDLLIHYPHRFTVSYLFLIASNSRINKKKPPNSRINEKKPPNSRINEKKTYQFTVILQWIERKIKNFVFTDFKFTENSWSQKTWIGRSYCNVFIELNFAQHCSVLLSVA